MTIINLLALLIASECSICSVEEKELIASVVINRSLHRKQSIKEVIYSPNQFHGIQRKGVMPSNEDWIIASRILMQGSVNKDIQYFYLRNSPYKKWRSKLKIINKQKYHNFCK